MKSGSACWKTTRPMTLTTHTLWKTQAITNLAKAAACCDLAVHASTRALKANGAKGAIVASMGENLPEGHAAELLKRGIVPILGIAEAMDAAAAAAFVGEAWRRPLALAVGAIPPSGLPAISPSRGEIGKGREPCSSCNVKDGRNGVPSNLPP